MSKREFTSSAPKTGAAVIAISAILVACGGGTAGVDSYGGDRLDVATRSSEFQDGERLAGATAAPDFSLTKQSLADANAKSVEAGASQPLDSIEPGAIAEETAYTSGKVAQKAAAVRTSAFRFYNGDTSAHFYTTSVAERDNVRAHMSPPYSYEGAAFSVANAYSPGLSAVHRFFNAQSGVHFYTVSDRERSNVLANFPQYHYEGVAYYASKVAGAGFVPFYRFYVPSRGFHFYTASESEKDYIKQNLSASYSYEGVGYYVLDVDWRAAKLPHTGVSASHCYEAGNDTAVVSCSSAGATGLNPLQDGHRIAINSMSYSALDSKPLSDCVRDDVTGLVWEVKTDDGGLRDKDNVYTNLGNQASTDASGYVNAINAAKLCGFSDWRMPYRNELINIMDFGRTAAPILNTTAFPNASSGRHWAADLERGNSARAWYVEFDKPWSYPESRTSAFSLRLVRGAKPSAPRFTFSTVAYGADGTNNVVNDAWTGLQWRRCEQGRTWNGSMCTGTMDVFLHEPALESARQQTGWRLPNVKELASISDLNSAYDGLIDPEAFPLAMRNSLWSSTPYGASVSSAMSVSFDTGRVLNYTRYITFNTLGIRLVRDDS